MNCLAPILFACAAATIVIILTEKFFLAPLLQRIVFSKIIIYLCSRSVHYTKLGFIDQGRIYVALARELDKLQTQILGGK
jgi:hypothetical protein